MFTRLWFAFVLCCIVAPTAKAVVAFDDFPNAGYENYGNWLGTYFDETMFLAQSFTPNVSGQLSQVQAEMWYIPSGGLPNTVTLEVLSQVGTVPPESASIWSESFNGDLTTSYSAVSTFNVNNGPMLQANTRYWLYAVVPTGGQANYIWQAGDAGTDAKAFYYTQGAPTNGPWEIFDPTTYPGQALRISVTVPEPASVLVIGCVSLPMLLRGPRRRGKA
jgi:hypothetical protein